VTLVDIVKGNFCCLNSA